MTEMVQHNCRICGIHFEMPKGMRRNGGILCLECARGYSREARQTRQKRVDEDGKVARHMSDMAPIQIGSTCGLCGSSLDERSKWQNPDDDGLRQHRLCNTCRTWRCDACAGYIQCSAPGRIHDKRALPCEWPYQAEVMR